MKARAVAGLVVLAMALQVVLEFGPSQEAAAIGVIAPVPHGMIKPRVVKATRHARPKNMRMESRSRKVRTRPGKHAKVNAKHARAIPQGPSVAPQDIVSSLKTTKIAPGVTYRSYNGKLNVNVIDVDMVNAPVQVRPVLATEGYKRLSDVKNQARQINALAAINANYFKKDGTPLGTLIINDEWIAGPLYDRVSMGITRCGYIRMDRVSLHGILETSNKDVPRLWVNNINQPRRTGARLIAYTRRWGPVVRMAYAGCLVAVNAQGEVVDKTTTVMTVPLGGIVLSDKKESPISKLKRGDRVELEWNPKPNSWDDVVNAISGGPMLMRDGKLFLDLKGERFRGGWAGRGIKARTAAGVTWNNHLLLVTIEGPHTLWDLAKFMHKLGAVEAMNLDGGGSTTMVVKGKTVTRNANSFQRHVASSLAVIQMPVREAIIPVRPYDFAPSPSLSGIDEAAAQFQARAESEGETPHVSGESEGASDTATMVVAEPDPAP